MFVLYPKYYYVHDLPKSPDSSAFYFMTGTERNPDESEHEYIEIWAWDSKNQSWCLCDKQYIDR